MTSGPCAYYFPSWLVFRQQDPPKRVSWKPFNWGQRSQSCLRQGKAQEDCAALEGLGNQVRWAGSTGCMEGALLSQAFWCPSRPQENLPAGISWHLGQKQQRAGSQNWWSGREAAQWSRLSPCSTALLQTTRVATKRFWDWALPFCTSEN